MEPLDKLHGDRLRQQEDGLSDPNDPGPLDVWRRCDLGGILPTENQVGDPRRGGTIRPGHVV